MSKASAQLSLNFEPGLTERFNSLKACVRDRIYGGGRVPKAVAADMDLSLSDLGRKLSDNPNDTRQLTCDDLEAFMRVTGDLTPLYYLAERFALSNEARQAFALAELTRLLPELQALTKQATTGGRR